MTVITMKDLLQTAHPKFTARTLLNTISLENDSLNTFIRIKRYLDDDITELYESGSRLSYIVERLILGFIPSLLINEVLTFQAFINTPKGKYLFFKHLEHLKTLHLTKLEINLENWTAGERRQVIKFNIQHQQRALYRKDSCHDFAWDLEQWDDELFGLDTWEFFDLNCLEDIQEADYSLEDAVHRVMEKMIPWARDDDLALFRLASLRYAKEILENKPPSVVRRYLRDTLQFGTEMQRLILELTDPTLKKPTNPLTESFDKVGLVLYDHFFELLQARGDPSPAFLLELIAFSGRKASQTMQLELLNALTNTYRLEYISPLLMYYSLASYSNEQQFWETLPFSWKTILKELVFFRQLYTNIFT